MIADPAYFNAPPTEQESQRAAESKEALAHLLREDQPLRLSATDGDAPTIEIPGVAARMLVDILDQISRGNAVTLVPIHAQLTTQQAADMLGVSRPYVVKEIESGKLPATKVGSHRRILFKDLMAYKKQSDAARRKALDEIARLDQELGLE